MRKERERERERKEEREKTEETDLDGEILMFGIENNGYRQGKYI